MMAFSYIVPHERLEVGRKLCRRPRRSWRTMRKMLPRGPSCLLEEAESRRPNAYRFLGCDAEPSKLGAVAHAARAAQIMKMGRISRPIFIVSGVVWNENELGISRSDLRRLYRSMSYSGSSGSFSSGVGSIVFKFFTNVSSTVRFCSGMSAVA